LIKGIILMGVIAIFFGAIGIGFVLILSGGNPIAYLQKTVIRFNLASRQDELNTPIGNDEKPVRFTINSGDSPSLIGRNLLDTGLIADASLFVDYLRSEDLDTRLQAGTYFLNQTQTIPQIAQTLLDSRNSSITFRVVEGSRIEEIAEAIDADRRFGFTGAEFLSVVGNGAQLDPALSQLLGIPTGATLEGFMYPDTYVLPPNVTATELRDQLLQAFISAVGQQMINDAIAQGYTMRNMVTLASIIERESVHSDEDVLISSVYRNRLAINMLLQADPTVQYALNGTRGRWWVNITQADYRGVVSPFNTYLNLGLPPNPIANPSLSALRAAVYPAESTYFYFRARCDGSNRHNFATTYDEHLANGC
jgi:UPF0755 protein